jgi:hypothetical protein
MKKIITSQTILEDVFKLMISPNLSEDGKRQALQIVYDLGVSNGKVEGARDMVERLKGSLS